MTMTLIELSSPLRTSLSQPRAPVDTSCHIDMIAHLLIDKESESHGALLTSNGLL
jgi:hypothetical protein